MNADENSFKSFFLSASISANPRQMLLAFFSPKGLFHPFDHAARLEFVVGLREDPQFFQGLALLFGQLRRCLHSDAYVNVSLASASQRSDALAFHPQHRARLRAFGNLQLVLAVESGNHDLRAEGGLRE